MAPERLLLVTDEMEVGGSQRQIIHLLSGLDRSRWEPELLFFRSPSWLVAEVERMGVRTHHLPKRGRIDPMFLLRFATLLRKRRYALVHAFSLTAELWTALACLSLRRRPRLVASVRGLYQTESRNFWRLKRFVAQRSTAVIANARACAASASAGTGIAAERFEVVANGVAVSAPLRAVDRENLRNSVGCPPDRPFALFVGRLVHEKNVECLLRAMARLPHAQRPWLALAGDGPLRARLRAQVDAAGVGDAVRFLGERSDATTLMQAADFLVLPSRQEGMSNAVLEAMAAGCPVIASAVGGNSELVRHDQTGLLFPNDDDDALSRCLQQLCLDPLLRARLAANARERVLGEYSIPCMVAATAAVYERCLKPSARPVASTGPHLGQRRAAGGDL